MAALSALMLDELSAPILDELSAPILDELSTPGLMVSPLEVTGCPWSGLVLVTPGPRVDFPDESVTPDFV
ncbi:MAG TPA: hypothetical protein VHR41_12600 [Gemmatimonadales bacterium]|nr:hypothetical protein [Gemmatimonadales bacterium]